MGRASRRYWVKRAARRARRRAGGFGRAWSEGVRGRTAARQTAGASRRIGSSSRPRCSARMAVGCRSSSWASFSFRATAPGSGRRYRRARFPRRGGAPRRRGGGCRPPDRAAARGAVAPTNARAAGRHSAADSAGASGSARPTVPGGPISDWPTSASTMPTFSPRASAWLAAASASVSCPCPPRRAAPRPPASPARPPAPRPSQWPPHQQSCPHLSTWPARPAAAQSAHEGSRCPPSRPYSYSCSCSCSLLLLLLVLLLESVTITSTSTSTSRSRSRRSRASLIERRLRNFSQANPRAVDGGISAEENFSRP